MIGEPRRIPRHVFVSHSTADKDAVWRISTALAQAGLDIWYARQDLQPGTANWQNAIREAMADASAVVVLCSPDAARSAFVQAELSLAERHHCPVYPVWLRGDHWVDCVPLAYANHQYVDYRAGDETLLKQLSDLLRQQVTSSAPRMFLAEDPADCPRLYLRILLPRDSTAPPSLRGAGWAIDGHHFGDRISAGCGLRTVCVDPSRYPSVEAVLYDLYTELLRDCYAPYTYGRDWVLAKASHYVTLLALPWQWLEHRRERRLIEVIPGYARQVTPLSEFGMDAGGVWAIVNTGFDAAFGLFSSSQQIAEMAWSDIRTKELLFVLAEGMGSESAVVPLADVDATAYRYRFVVVAESRWGKPLPPDSVVIL